MKSAGGTVYVSDVVSGSGSATDPYIHAKTILVDCATGTCAKGFVGSENMTTGSLEYNRELGVIITDPTQLGIVYTAMSTDFANPKNTKLEGTEGSALDDQPELCPANGGGRHRRESRRGGLDVGCEIAPDAADEAEAPPAERQVIGLARGSGPYRVLVVDDSLENRRLLARLFAFDGLEVREPQAAPRPCAFARRSRRTSSFSTCTCRGWMEGEAVWIVRASGAGACGERRGRARGEDRRPVGERLRDGSRRSSPRRLRCVRLEAVPRVKCSCSAPSRRSSARASCGGGESGGAHPDADAATPERLRQLP